MTKKLRRIPKKHLTFLGSVVYILVSLMLRWVNVKSMIPWAPSAVESPYGETEDTPKHVGVLGNKEEKCDRAQGWVT